MKETPMFEEIFLRLISQRSVWLKLLIGGLLSFVPVINFFAFGYLYRYALGLRNQGDLVLPNWSDWQGMFFDGIRFAVVWVIYWLLPMLILSCLSLLFTAIGLGAVSSLFYAISFTTVSVVFCAALYRYQMRFEFKDLSDFVLIGRMAAVGWQRYLIPSIVVWGLFQITPVIYGFTLFAGFVLLIAYTTLNFKKLETQGI